jgi:alpha-glucosidase (family GH31 glycosyl hydrolase)
MTEVLAHQHLRLPLLPGEVWWGGAVADGQLMPFGLRTHHRDLAGSAGVIGDARVGNNQSAPLLLSNRGRFIWSELPFEFDITDDAVDVVGSELVHGRAGNTLQDAFRTASAAFFPGSGKTPAPQMLKAPQYNTWIEMPYRPTQDGVLQYARDLLGAGFPPGVLMIDDRWSTEYGTWTFDPVTFPDPSAMVETLHALGFTVMLWLVPFVSPDTATFNALAAQGFLVREPGGEPAIRQWWNGCSAVLDATHPGAADWLHRALGALVTEHGVDGFKFDGGDFYSYAPTDRAAGAVDPAGQCEAWARIGLRYPFNEYRACWKMGGQPLVQRLHDKPPTWGPGGLGSLIPEAIAQGLIGHAFVCPDMVGGGDLGIFRTVGVDAEFFVRYAQCAALFPMMQFSVSPARVLDEIHLTAVLSAVELHQQLVPEIAALAKNAARTGEPILRPLAYHHPGYEHVVDQFLLGEDILAAPVLERRAPSRRVVLPPGTWTAPDGTSHQGPTTIELPVTLESIPWFRRDTTLEQTGLPSPGHPSTPARRWRSR